MAVDTTGSTVIGLVPGLISQFKGVVVVTVNGDPSNVVAPPVPMTNPSGVTIAFDPAARQFYENLGGASGATWQKLGSTA